MRKPTVAETNELPTSPKGALTILLRDGAQQLLAAGLDAEVEAYLAEFADVGNEAGHRKLGTASSFAMGIALRCQSRSALERSR